MAKKIYSKETVQLYVKDIKPYEFNTKRHSDTQIKQLAEQMSKIYIDLIVVDQNNVIVKGHGRHAAMQLLGWETCDVIKLSGFTQDEIDLLRIADNQLNKSPDDVSNLQREIKRLSGLFDLTTIGFSYTELAIYGVSQETQEKIDDNLAKSIASVNAGIEEEEEDKMPELPQDMLGTQNQKKPLTFFCTLEQFDILSPIFATSRKWEANTELLLEYVNKG